MRIEESREGLCIPFLREYAEGVWLKA